MTFTIPSILVLFTVLAVNGHQNRAIVVLTGDPGVTGQVTFTETPAGLLVEGTVNGLTPGKHGFHIHVSGDLSKGCISTLGHYNPLNQEHGAPEDHVRHAGDLGNIIADKTGVANIHITDKEISLTGDRCILGRAVVVHSGEDDLGKGGHKDSKTTGNAGGRVACGVIGIL